MHYVTNNRIIYNSIMKMNAGAYIHIKIINKKHFN